MPEQLAWDEYVGLEPGPGLVDLAGFAGDAVQQDLAQSGLILAVPDSLHPGPGRRAEVEQLFTLLADADIAYRREALDSLGDQVVRSRSRILREGGTCLDLALLFCAQLLAADLRPHLVLDYGRRGPAARGETNHALVLVDLLTPRTQGRASWAPGVSRAEGALGRWSSKAALSKDWVLFDPTLACRDPLAAGERDLSASESLAWERLGGQVDDCRVVDVAAALNSGTALPRALPTSGPGLLSRRCPPPVGDLEFGSHAELGARLAESAGTTVLVGEQGVGKSTLALSAVRTATRGAGWFLAGSSRRALLNALAQAEGDELGLDAEVVAADVDGYAQAALGRLRGVDGPWTVVIDNADLPPGPILDLLPQPDPRRRQHLLVTTTDTDRGQAPGWRETSRWRTGAVIVDVAPLSDAEVLVLLPERPTHRPAGLQRALRLPLVLRAVHRLHASGYSEAARAVADDDDPIRGYVVQLLGQQDPLVGAELRRLAVAAALLPPDGVPGQVYRDLGPDSSGSPHRLVELGLLTQAGNSYALHRLFGAAVRAVASPSLPSLAADLLLSEGVSAFLAAAYDPTVVAQLHSQLTSSDGESHAGAALAELAALVDERGDPLQAMQVAADALQLLPEDGDPDVRAACLLAAPRYANQHLGDAARLVGRSKEEVLTDALQLAAESERWAADPRLKGKAVAMRGLLTQKKTEWSENHDQRLAILSEAERLIGEGLRLRAKAMGADRPDPTGSVQLGDIRLSPAVVGTRDRLELAKAMFNLSGVSIKIAKEDPERAQESLRLARTVYEEVGQIRRRAFGASPHRHVAACIAGEGTVDYYAAALTSTTAEQALQLLRAASDALARSLHMRESISPVSDDGDVRKSLRLHAKLALARAALAELPSAGGKAPTPDDALPAEVARELAPAWQRLRKDPPVG